MRQLGLLLLSLVVFEILCEMFLVRLKMVLANTCWAETPYPVSSAISNGNTTYALWQIFPRSFGWCNDSEKSLPSEPDSKGKIELLLVGSLRFALKGFGTSVFFFLRLHNFRISRDNKIPHKLQLFILIGVNPCITSLHYGSHISCIIAYVFWGIFCCGAVCTFFVSAGSTQWQFAAYFQQI